MTKHQISKVSKRLDWQMSEVSEAMDELLKTKSIIKNWPGYFKLCVDSQNPELRWEKVREFIYETIPQNEMIECINKSLSRPDPCFIVCSLFNMSDMKKGTGIVNSNLAYNIWNTHKERRSFTLIVHTHNHKHWPHLFYEPVLDPMSLCDHFFSWIIYNRVKNRESFLRNVVTGIGFQAFNISALRAMVADFLTFPDKTPIAKKLTKDLEKFLTNSGRTERKYWLYYTLVESLKAKGLKPMHAYNQGATILKMQPETLRVRYQERKNKLKSINATNPNYNINNIIEDFNLELDLNKFLESYN